MIKPKITCVGEQLSLKRIQDLEFGEWFLCPATNNLCSVIGLSFMDGSVQRLVCIDHIENREQHFYAEQLSKMVVTVQVEIFYCVAQKKECVKT